MTFLVNGARCGEPGVFTTFEERAGDLTLNVASLGYDLDRLVEEGRIAVDHVRIDSEVGRGTEVCLSLPRHLGPSEVDHEERQGGHAPGGARLCWWSMTSRASGCW